MGSESAASYPKHEGHFLVLVEGAGIQVYLGLEVRTGQWP